MISLDHCANDYKVAATTNASNCSAVLCCNRDKRGNIAKLPPLSHPSFETPLISASARAMSSDKDA